MRLEPGGMRELHWHATAAEWGYLVEGRCRTTVLSPDGSAETNDFDPGDVWYFPKGHPHSIQGLGPGICHFVLIFDNGAFSEFGTFSVTDWLGHSAGGLLTKNLGLDAAAQTTLPHEEVYFARGPVPPAEQAPYLGHFPWPEKSHKFRMMLQEPHFVGRGGTEWLVDQSSFPIASTIASVRLDLAPGGLRELHWHPNADEWQYILKGTVRMTMFGSHGRYRTEIFEAGDTGYIPMGYGHSIENASDKEPAEVLIGFNTGQYEGINLSTWLAAHPPCPRTRCRSCRGASSSWSQGTAPTHDKNGRDQPAPARGLACRSIAQIHPAGQWAVYLVDGGRQDHVPGHQQRHGRCLRLLGGRAARTCRAAESRTQP